MRALAHNRSPLTLHCSGTTKQWRISAVAAAWPCSENNPAKSPAISHAMPHLTSATSHSSEARSQPLPSTQSPSTNVSCTPPSTSSCSKDMVEDVRLGALECMAALYYAQGRFLSIGVQETVAVAIKYCGARWVSGCVWGVSGQVDWVVCQSGTLCSNAIECLLSLW